MTDKKYAILGYDTLNLGDDIQSFVTSTLINPSYIILRDDYDKIYDYSTGNITSISDEKIYLIMNGWFIHSSDRKYSNKKNIKFPISNSKIVPIFISSCLSKDCPELFKEQSINYYKNNSPILCRDFSTLELLKKNNVDSEFYGCLTQTLDIKDVGESSEYEEKFRNKVLLVHGNDQRKFNNIKLNRNEKIVINHYDNKLKSLNPRQRIDYAKDLLLKYKYAKKIYTTRLHCFLPCRAMGLDVEYIGEKNYRTKDLIDITPDKDTLLKKFYLKIT